MCACVCMCVKRGFTGMAYTLGLGSSNHSCLCACEIESVSILSPRTWMSQESQSAAEGLEAWKVPGEFLSEGQRSWI